MFKDKTQGVYATVLYGAYTVCMMLDQLVTKASVPYPTGLFLIILVGLFLFGMFARPNIEALFSAGLCAFITGSFFIIFLWISIGVKYQNVWQMLYDAVTAVFWYSIFFTLSCVVGASIRSIFHWILEDMKNPGDT